MLQESTLTSFTHALCHYIGLKGINENKLWEGGYNPEQYYPELAAAEEAVHASLTALTTADALAIHKPMLLADTRSIMFVS
jgi:hypothetical protein